MFPKNQHKFNYFLPWIYFDLQKTNQKRCWNPSEVSSTNYHFHTVSSYVWSQNLHIPLWINLSFHHFFFPSTFQKQVNYIIRFNPNTFSHFLLICFTCPRFHIIIHKQATRFEQKFVLGFTQTMLKRRWNCV